MKVDEARLKVIIFLDSIIHLCSRLRLYYIIVFRNLNYLRKNILDSV